MLELWFIAAVLFVILEVVLGFTIVFLFASIASFIIGITLSLGVLEEADVVNQVGMFFAISVVSSILLLRPLKNMMMKRNSTPPVNNYVGQTVVLQDETLIKGNIGHAKWSGTIVKIKIEEDDDGQIYKSGDILRVVNVVDNVFIVQGEE